MAKRPYYYKAQLLAAISFLESGRPQKALRVLQITRDVLDGHKPMEEPNDYTNVTLRVSNSL
jgi:hypothetical protein